MMVECGYGNPNKRQQVIARSVTDPPMPRRRNVVRQDLRGIPRGLSSTCRRRSAGNARCVERRRADAVLRHVDVRSAWAPAAGGVFGGVQVPELATVAGIFVGL